MNRPDTTLYCDPKKGRNIILRNVHAIEQNQEDLKRIVFKNGLDRYQTILGLDSLVASDPYSFAGLDAQDRALVIELARLAVADLFTRVDWDFIDPDADPSMT